MYYKLLEDKTAVPFEVQDLPGGYKELDKYFRDIKARRVDLTFITNKVSVSTVFLVISHGFNWQLQPVLFETMVFANGFSFDLMCIRASTWNEALLNHKRVVNQISHSLRRKLAKNKSRRKRHDGKTD